MDLLARPAPPPPRQPATTHTTHKKGKPTLSPIIMEVENKYPQWKETKCGETHFPLPWLWQVPIFNKQSALSLYRFVESLPPKIRKLRTESQVAELVCLDRFSCWILCTVILDTKKQRNNNNNNIANTFIFKLVFASYHTSGTEPIEYKLLFFRTVFLKQLEGTSLVWYMEQISDTCFCTHHLSKN